MLSTEEIFRLRQSLYLNSKLRGDLVSELNALFDSNAYQAWHKTAGLEPFREVHSYKVLKNLALCNDSSLRFKINKIGRIIYLTDSVLVPPDIRVFPFSDESEDLLSELSNETDFKYNWAMDLATGCGHTALQLTSLCPTIAMDINPRALAYSHLNSMLNDISAEKLSLVLKDIRGGVTFPGSGLGLVLANLPFGTSPVPGAMPLTSDGGRYGLDYQKFFFGLLKTAKEKQNLKARILVLGKSFGSSTKNQWQIQNCLFRELGVQAEWKILKNTKIPRTNGLRELPNPVSAEEALWRSVNCSVYVKNKTPEVINAYTELIEELETTGDSELSYGVLDFQVG